jgi:transcriptional antiterminator RfaH
MAVRLAVFERLRDNGFDCYRPLCRVRVRRHGKPVYVERPVLGRYMFVQMMVLPPANDWPHQFQKIKATAGKGMYGILMSEEKPLVVKHQEIQTLRDKEVRGYIPNSFKQRFKPLQRVIISRGPLVNQEAIFKREKGALDVVEISLFGSSREICMPMGSVIAA